MVFRRLYEMIRRPSVRFPEPVIGRLDEVWNRFFRGLNVDFNNPNNIYQAFLMFLSLNLMGIRDPQNLLPQEVRNRLQDLLNNTRNEVNQLQSQIGQLQNLDPSIRQQIEKLVANVLDAINSVLQQPNPQQLSSLANLLNTLLIRLTQPSNQQFQQLQTNIQNLQAQIKSLEEFLSRTLPLELINLRDIYISNEFYESITRGDRSAIVRFGEGLQRIREHLRSGGSIQIIIGNQNDLQALGNFLSSLGLNLDLNNDDTRRRLGIEDQNNTYYLSVNPLRIGMEGVNTLQDLENRIRELVSQREEREKNLKARSEEVNKAMREAQERGNETLRRFFELYGQILQEVNRIETTSRNILNKFALSNTKSFLTGKEYNRYVKSRILEYATFLHQLERELNDLDRTVQEVIEGRREVTQQMIEALERMLIELQTISKALQEISNLTAENVPPFPKRLWEAFKNITGVLSGAGLIAGIIAVGWIGAFAFLPWGLIAWAEKQIKENLLKSSSSK